jgi:hypothetical protein
MGMNNARISKDHINPDIRGTMINIKMVLNMNIMTMMDTIIMMRTKNS